ncbi:MAG: threonylcarbamoyladenosine tRNA methylthiotransferase MtaB [Clostridia bacterium]|nr:threonylcarbamoyladenosine tRNA methylthiotransferase MtaB [Clostridia bacterium]
MPGDKQPQRAALISLGCKVNQAELEGIKSVFQQAGYLIVDFEEPADVYVIHTCTVTHLSDRKSRQLIRRANRQNPEAVVVVTGCYAQVAPDEVLAIPGVDVVVGTRGRHRLPELIARARETRKAINAVKEHTAGEPFEELPVGEPSRARAFLKIQEGCEEYCRYCIVPYARGPLRSLEPEKAVAAVQRLLAAGFKEIVLTGVHTGAYGRDLGRGIDLNYLLQRLVRLPGLLRLRISSLDPPDFSDELIATLGAADNICPHFHIPLQSGDDYILQRMGRKYTVGQYRDLVAAIRAVKPGVAITTDVIVGFPGEGKENFARTLEFVREIAFARLHVFPFSPRAGTPAAALPDQVPAEVKKERVRELIAVGRGLARKYAAGFIGRVVKVLVEKQVPGRENTWEGHSENYLKVNFQAPGRELTGEIVPVVLEEIRGETTWGKIFSGQQGKEDAMAKNK